MPPDGCVMNGGGAGEEKPKEWGLKKNWGVFVLLAAITYAIGVQSARDAYDLKNGLPSLQRELKTLKVQNSYISPLVSEVRRTVPLIKDSMRREYEEYVKSLEKRAQELSKETDTLQNRIDNINEKSRVNSFKSWAYLVE